MKGLFVSLGIHAVGVVGLMTLPAFSRGAPPPDEPPHAPLVSPLLRVQTTPTVMPPRGRNIAGGGGGMLPPRPDARPVPPPHISEEPLKEPGPEIGPLDLPPGPLGPKPGVDAGPWGTSQTVAPPAVVRADIDVRPPHRITGANPGYPPLALAARIQGTVVLECTIAPDGHVVDLRVLRGHPLLDAAAVQAVSGWTYVPTLLNGRPVSVLMTVTVRFQLH